MIKMKTISTEFQSKIDRYIADRFTNNETITQEIISENRVRITASKEQPLYNLDKAIDSRGYSDFQLKCRIIEAHHVATFEVEDS
jgi:hypothetical protein